MTQGGSQDGGAESSCSYTVPPHTRNHTTKQLYNMEKQLPLTWQQKEVRELHSLWLPLPPNSPQLKNSIGPLQLHKALIRKRNVLTHQPPSLWQMSQPLKTHLKPCCFCSRRDYTESCALLLTSYNPGWSVCRKFRPYSAPDFSYG